MPTEEEIRRRCIIDPESCPGGPPPPAAAPSPGEKTAALGEELWDAYKSPHDQPWVHLSPNDQAPWKRQAEALEKVWEFHLIGAEKPHHKPAKGKKAEHHEDASVGEPGTPAVGED